MKKYPCVLTIAGSDCSGGAGIQADIKTISALGAYAASAITAITVQNTCGVEAVLPIPPMFISGQIEAVLSDIHPKAVKIGMVNDATVIKCIAECLDKFQPEFVVLDPVMVSSSGRRLMEDTAIQALISELIPQTTLITPNLSEAEVLTGNSVSTIDDMKRAAKELLNYGSKAVLVKGGHLTGGNMTDVLQLTNREDPILFTSPQIESRNTHGTGCTLSSAIATFLSLGETLENSIKKAKFYLYRGITEGKDVYIGNGHGPLNHLYNPIPMHIFTENE